MIQPVQQTAAPRFDAARSTFSRLGRAERVELFDQLADAQERVDPDVVGLRLREQRLLADTLAYFTDLSRRLAADTFAYAP